MTSLSSLKTGRRVINANTTFTVNEPAAGTMGDNEGDSNADTCCLGTNFVVLEFTGRMVDVYPYQSSYKPIENVPIVKGATAWDCPDTGVTYILVINEGLYYGSNLDHSLFNPNQIRANGIDFNDNPFDKDKNLGIDIEGGPFIPMQFHGTKLRFNSRSPTQSELNNCEKFELTSSLIWEPNSVILGKVNQVTPSLTAHDHNIFGDDEILCNFDKRLVMLKELVIGKMSAVIDDAADLHLDVPVRRTFVSNERHLRKTSEALAELWGIGPLRAKATLRATTQRGTRSAILPLSRRYRADRRYNVKRLDGKFSTDTLYADTVSLHSNKYAQIYSHKCGFTVCYPMRTSTAQCIGHSLKDFIHDFGIPFHLTFDGAQAQIGKKSLFMETIRQQHIKYHVSAPYRPNQNPSEASIRELKKRWYRIMLKKNVPRRLWDHGLTWVADTGNITVTSSKYAQGRTPLEIITGETPDISDYTDFGFYDWVIYHPNAGLGEKCYGRWLGVSHTVGELMSYWILTIGGRVISCSTVTRITNAEQQTNEWKERFSSFTQAIEPLMNAKNIDNGDEMAEQPAWNRLSLSDDDQDFVEEFNRVINDESIPEADAYSPDSHDSYLNMEIGLPRGDDDALLHATVKRRAVDVDGKPIGVASNNPLTDSRKYEVEFDDGTSEILSANIIAENILAQVDDDGHKHLVMKEIIDHRSDPKVALPISESHYVNNKGTRVNRRTTKGWELCVEWRDGSTDWIALKDLKQSYPVELARYATINNLDKQPAFAWWVPWTIKKGTRIAAKLKSKYWQRTHKYGIRLPKSVEEAYKIDKENNNTLWRDAIEQEMKKIREAFSLYDGNPNELIGYQKITTHFIFDVKLGENFRRKARLVGDGHKTKTPASVTYSSVVSRDSVRICLLLAALNDLDIQAADIENAYLTAPCREKVWTIGGPEFGSDQGKPFLVVKALYGLKSSGAAFRAFLAETLDEIGFRSSIADPDVWMRAAVKPDGQKYYEYILVYVDDILCISHDAKAPMLAITRNFKFKKNDISPPQVYLGARLEKKELNGKLMWTMTSRDYINAIVKNLNERLKKKGTKLPASGIDTPMTSNYSPELDGSEELEPDDITMFQELIGELRWAIEIGRVDILTEVSMLSAYQASPRQGHLEQVIHIYAFLNKKPKLTLYFNPEEPKIDADTFVGNNAETFKEQYRDATEELPPNMPIPRGLCVTTTAYVDASHAANKVTRRSHTGFILFVNRAPIVWYSKRQSTIESSTFTSEFIAMKTCMEAIVSLRYKLRMFGVPVDGPTKVLCDNQSVVNNSSKIESVLNKKHSSIAYHAVRWAVAASIMVVGKILGDVNLSDAMTKRLTAQRREFLFSQWTY